MSVNKLEFKNWPQRVTAFWLCLLKVDNNVETINIFLAPPNTQIHLATRFTERKACLPADHPIRSRWKWRWLLWLGRSRGHIIKCVGGVSPSLPRSSALWRHITNARTATEGNLLMSLLQQLGGSRWPWAPASAAVWWCRWCLCRRKSLAPYELNLCELWALFSWFFGGLGGQFVNLVLWQRARARSTT